MLANFAAAKTFGAEVETEGETLIFLTEFAIRLESSALLIGSMEVKEFNEEFGRLQPNTFCGARDGKQRGDGVMLEELEELEELELEELEELEELDELEEDDEDE